MFSEKYLVSKFKFNNSIHHLIQYYKRKRKIFETIYNHILFGPRYCNCYLLFIN